MSRSDAPAACLPEDAAASGEAAVRVRRRPLLLHPVLFAVYPALFLFGQNAGRVHLSAAAPALAISLVGMAAVWLLAIAALRSRERAALLTSLLLVWFATYGHVFELWGNGMRQRYLLLAWAALLALIVTVALRARGPLARVTRALNMAGVALVAAALGTAALRGGAARYGAPAHAALPPLPIPVESQAAAPVAVAQRPDIYYIILDSYAGPQTLSTYLGFDNTPFIEGLERRGFYVARESRSNYAFTLESVPSSLNMDFVNALGSQLGADSRDLSPSARLIEDNRVAGFLRERGYRCVAIDPPSRFEQAGFGSLVWNSTLLRSIDDKDYDASRRRTLDAFQSIEQVAAMPGPTFCYAHIYCPHAPFVFRADGGPVPTLRQRLHLAGPAELGRLYTDEVRFLNRRVTALVDTLITRSPAPPIIILQADHGLHDLTPPWPPTDDCIRQRMRILNAYYLPSDGRPAAPALYPSISPVNSFRVVLDRYFGAKLPLLPDRSYYSTYRAPYRFLDVTDRLTHDGHAGHAHTAGATARVVVQ